MIYDRPGSSYYRVKKCVLLPGTASAVLTSAQSNTGATPVVKTLRKDAGSMHQKVFVRNEKDKGVNALDFNCMKQPGSNPGSKQGVDLLPGCNIKQRYFVRDPPENSPHPTAQGQKTTARHHWMV